MVLELTGEAWAAVQTHVRSAGASEACGFLLGDRSGSRARVLLARPARNLAADPRRAYLVDPGDWLAAMEEAELKNLLLVGYYHSHPDGSTSPSATDLAGAWPDHYYLIVAGSPSAFTVVGGEARRVEVVIE